MTPYAPSIGREFSILIFAAFIFIAYAESTNPLRKASRSRLFRFPVNLVFTLLAFIVGSAIVRPTSLRIALFNLDSEFGLLGMLNLPPSVEFIVGLLLLDLSFYYWHRLNHELGILWRFHLVHHIDPDLDISTSFRFHPIEIAYSTVFRILQISLIGATPTLYIFYETLFSIATIFEHSNFRLPLIIEKKLNYLLVTPRMHGIHHSGIENETNSNYSVVFSFWDRLHRTIRLGVNQADIDIGVPAYTNPGDNRFLNLLTAPFKSMRTAWISPDGVICLERQDGRPGADSEMRE